MIVMGYDILTGTMNMWVSMSNVHVKFVKKKMPYLSGEVVYQLRNSFLHQGTPNVDKNKIRNESNKLDKFTLIIEKKNEFDIYADASSVGMERSYRVNIRRLCLILTLTAKGYFETHEDEFDFFEFSVLDI